MNRSIRHSYSFWRTLGNESRLCDRHQGIPVPTPGDYVVSLISAGLVVRPRLPSIQGLSYNESPRICVSCNAGGIPPRSCKYLCHVMDHQLLEYGRVVMAPPIAKLNLAQEALIVRVAYIRCVYTRVPCPGVAQPTRSLARYAFFSVSTLYLFLFLFHTSVLRARP